MADRLRCLRGKVLGDWLVTNRSKQYKLKGHKLYHNKEGFFLVRNGYVYRFIPVKDVFKQFP